jgi:hypothetical protein
MNNKFLVFFAALVVSLALSFVAGDLIPWGAGGLGILVGVLFVRGDKAKTALKGFLVPAIGLALTLYLIENQYYNPEWLSRLALFGRVFVSHSLIATTLFEARQRLNEL